MMTRVLQLGRPDLAGEIEGRYRKEKNGKQRMRLLCVKLTAEGGYSAQQIAEICGFSRASVFKWIRAMRGGGFEALLQRGKPGPAEGQRRNLPVKVSRQLETGLATGRWSSAEQVRHWLREEYGIKRPYKTVWNWLKKLDGVLRVPRPSHPAQNKEAVEGFKNDLAPGSKVWVYRLALE